MDENFKDYLLQEYEEIAGAHFKTLESISAFFKNYLVIMSLPAAVFSFFFQKESFASFSNLLIALSFIAFSGIGIGVCLYIINLRLDAILYARTVNGIRRFFYNAADIDHLQKAKIRTLPISTMVPAYHDSTNFWPVLLVFSIFNGIYASTGVLFLAAFYFDISKTDELGSLLAGIYATPSSVFIVIAAVHFLLFKELAWYREFAYLKSNIIGIDIDGVLNKHRQHFCDILTQLGGSLLPEDITSIPIHEIPNLNPPLSRAKEIEVFNTPSYWLGMPTNEGSADNVKKLVNSFGLRVCIFTYRPWPDTTGLDAVASRRVQNEWLAATLQFIHTIPGRKRRYVQLAKHYLYYRHRKGAIINQATRLWLDSFGFKYHKLIVEKGNENLLSKTALFTNRMAFSGKKRIKYFVEDDLEKALKLSYICDVVYLIDHPYNQSPDELPSNIMRVTGWNDISRSVRKII